MGGRSGSPRGLARVRVACCRMQGCSRGCADAAASRSPALPPPTVASIFCVSFAPKTRASPAREGRSARATSPGHSTGTRAVAPWQRGAASSRGGAASSRSRRAPALSPLPGLRRALSPLHVSPYHPPSPSSAFYCPPGLRRRKKPTPPVSVGGPHCFSKTWGGVKSPVYLTGNRTDVTIKKSKKLRNFRMKTPTQLSDTSSQ